ncbi:LacI family transcriptional regulator [Streptomyces sp. 8K308]|uniref:LacI family DNA-binding transcriptional regulator n=1 Tax=Streptomyces sp. 8K308 TaxID=2530388 RepID=UPI00104B74C5|nr:LacI family DNA-binding transcriptional regulator [Streptomyces sp. 8K308]TDC23587.1 LacI family transcriptional regulator [Streptomyces sp. 8K308]
MNNHRPTIEQVAARAGVGRGTVSRVINDSGAVSERARQAVLRAIDELGYVPNRAASALAGHRTRTVALVMSETDERRFEQPYFGQIVGGISAAAEAAGLALTLRLTQSDAERADLADQLRAQRVDGVLMISLVCEDPLPARLEGYGMPTVLGGRPCGLDVVPTSYVDADNRDGARRATEYLVGRDRRRIATIAGPQDTTAGIDRLAGYREALAGRPERVAYGDFSVSGGMVAMRRLLDADPLLDAVFAASDNMALGALWALQERGLRVPDDVAVVGFEDALVTSQAQPALTTVHQPTAAMGRRMIELLLDRLRGAPTADAPVICDTSLLVRESA